MDVRKSFWSGVTSQSENGILHGLPKKEQFAVAMYGILGYSITHPWTIPSTVMGFAGAIVAGVAIGIRPAKDAIVNGIKSGLAVNGSIIDSVTANMDKLVEENRLKDEDKVKAEAEAKYKADYEKKLTDAYLGRMSN